MKQKILVPALLAGGLSFGLDLKFHVAPYFTYINYDNSNIKKDGWASTLYGSLTVNKNHVIEAAYGYTHLNYKHNYTNWNQNDYTIAYTNYMFSPFYGKIGFHYIATPNEDLSKGGKIAFVDFGYIKRYKWNAGLEAYYTDYKYGVNVFQINPKGGFYIWKDYYRGFYFSGKLGFLKINKKTWRTNYYPLHKKGYYYLEYGITYFTPKYSITLDASIGERIFEVANGGFVVYNLPERYYGRTELKGTYYFNKHLSATLSGSLGNYKESSTNDRVKVYTITASIGYSF